MFVRRVAIVWVVGLAAMLLLPSRALMAQATGPVTATQASDVAGPLKIHITAVQGGAQFRPQGQTKWQTARADTDLDEGAELRTGPRGTIQFIVGTDQTYRVDRLTVVKVLRANLRPDGTIITDVGMTYGRVSKDVDLPAHPHLDTIVSPSSTLAVRGTRVSLYDQPPYAPQAFSLTGAAIFSDHLKGLSVPFGKKGAGKVSVDSNHTSAADALLATSAVNGTSTFGQTAAEAGIQAAFGGAVPGGVFSPTVVSGTAVMKANQAILGSLPLGEELLFQFIWTSSTPNTMVDFSVTSPLHEVVSSSMPSVTAPSGGAYGSNASPVAVGSTGFQYVSWGDYTNAGSKFPLGAYTITATLTGASGSPGPISLTTDFQGIQLKPGGNSSTTTLPIMVPLSSSSPTVTYTVHVPIPQGAPVVHVP